jgi:hypothetical protein
MPSIRLSFAVLIITAGLFGAGCKGPYSERKEISGTIKLGGEPLNGDIEFEPLENQATKSGTTIFNGEYRILQRDGLVPGKYLVRITAGDGVTPANPEDIAGPSSTNIVSKDRIPDDWGVKSKQEVTVTKEGPNKFNYDIPAKSK